MKMKRHVTDSTTIDVQWQMTAHLSCDGVRVSVDDPVEVPAPHAHAVHVSGRDVAEEVNLLPAELRHLQLVHQPLQLVRGVRGVQQQPQVLVHAVVHVQTAESHNESVCRLVE